MALDQLAARLTELGSKRVLVLAPPSRRHVDRVMALWFQLQSALSPTLTSWARERMLADWAATWGSHRSYYG